MSKYRGMTSDSCYFAMKESSDKMSSLVNKAVRRGGPVAANMLSLQDAENRSRAKLPVEEQTVLALLKSDPGLYASKLQSFSAIPEHMKTPLRYKPVSEEVYPAPDTIASLRNQYPSTFFYVNQRDKTAAINLAAFAKALSKTVAPKVSKGFGASAKRFLGSSSLMGGLRTLQDEEMRQRHGIAGTFSRKMASPKTWIMGGITSTVAPALSKYGPAGMGKLGGAIKGKATAGWRHKVGGTLQKGGDFFGGKLVDLSPEAIERSGVLKQSAAVKDGARQTLSALKGHKRKGAARFKQVRSHLKKSKEALKRGENLDRIGRQGAKDYVRQGMKTNKWGQRLNPFNPLSAVGIAGGMTGVAGPWSPGSALYEEDSTWYKPFQSKAFDPYRKNERRFT